MSRRRWRITLLAALATLSAVYPITTLFQSSSWLGGAVLVVGLVAGVGLLLRGLTHSRLLIAATQVLVVGFALLWTFAGETLSYLLLPTLETLEQLNSLGLEALDTVQRYSAPAPLNGGVIFCLVVAVALVAICVDAMAATWRSPAAAGLPLLTAYLITAANGQSALALRYFVVPVALWLLMVHTTARAQFGRWGTTSASGGDPAMDVAHDRQALRSFSAGAAKLGLVGVVAALLVPALVPHFPPRYLTEGLGRTAGGEGSGSVGFNDTLDLTRSLNNTDETPVLSYTTNNPARTPLRVLATGYYSRGQWLVVGNPRGGSASPQPLPPPGERRDYEMTVSENTLAAPRIASPYPVVAVAMEGTPWTIDPVTRDVRVGQAVSTYRVTYADLAPAPPLLRESGEPNSPDVTDDDVTLPDTARDLLETWSAEVTRGADNPLDKAIAIQDHLRDTSTYTYTLDLGESLRDEAGRIIEPIRTFYETRRGYCVQFATAMVMLARAQGIPARMAIGFLPGSAVDGKNVVKASDAHSWPELFFEGYGWLRFEPTPGARSGTPPAYAVLGSDSGPTGGGRAVDDTETSGAATSSVAATTTAVPQAVALPELSALEQVGSVFSVRNLVTLLTVLVLLLALCIMPITAWLLRERRRREARTRQDLIEIDWTDLTSHLRDLGLPAPEGGTLRQLREKFIAEGHFDPDNASAMRRVTATLEKSRYDRPERTTAEEAEALHRDIRTVRRGVGRTRAWSTRVRSFLWPEAGVSFWQSLPSRVTDLLTRR